MIALACAATVRVCGPPCTSVHPAPDGTCHLRRAAATRRTPPPAAIRPPATHPACAGQLDRGGLASVQGGDAAGGGGRGGRREEAAALAASGAATAAVLAPPDRPDRGQGHVGAAVRPAAPPPRPPSRPAHPHLRRAPQLRPTPLPPSPRRSLLAVCCGWKLRGYCTAAGRAAVRRATRTKRPEPVAPGVVLPSSSARRRPSKRGRTSADPAPRHPLLLPSPSPGSAAVADHTQ